MSGLFNMLHRSVGQKNNKNTSKTVVSKTDNESQFKIFKHKAQTISGIDESSSFKLNESTSKFEILNKSFNGKALSIKNE